MRKYGLQVLIAILLLGAWAAPGQEALYPCGLLPEMTSSEGALGALAAAAPDEQPLGASLDLSSSFPTPGDQGNLGSCVSWCTGYGIKAYMEKVERGWDLNLNSSKFCANYIYNQINGGADNGSYTSDAFKIMAWRGITTLADQASSGSDFTTWPTQAQCQAAQNFRNAMVGSFEYGSVNKSDLAGIKAKLNAGIPLALGFDVDSAWDNLGSGTSYVWYPNSTAIRGGHCIAVIGFDDAKTDGAGHVGALKVQNSWGTGWGSSGRAWVAYDALNTSAVQSGLYYGADRAGFTSTIQAKIKITHAKRGCIRIDLGVGSTSSPAWSSGYYKALSQSNDVTHADVQTTLDLTDAAGLWPPTPSQMWWVRVTDSLGDSVTGTLTEFSVTKSGVTFSTFTGLPMSLPDSTAAYAYIRGRRPGDFGGDGKADVLLRHPSNGDVVLWLMNGVSALAP